MKCRNDPRPQASERSLIYVHHLFFTGAAHRVFGTKRVLIGYFGGEWLNGSPFGYNNTRNGMVKCQATFGTTKTRFRWRPSDCMVGNEL